MNNFQFLDITIKQTNKYGKDINRFHLHEGMQKYLRRSRSGLTLAGLNKKIKKLK